MKHEYIHVGGGALYCNSCKVLVTEQDGAAAVRDMKEHETDPCCEECVAWRSGEDEQGRQDALQDAINAAHERLKMAEQGVFITRGHPLEAAAPHMLADAWDEGWHEHFLEWGRQRKDPSHPITRTNPYRTTA